MNWELFDEKRNAAIDGMKNQLDVALQKQKAHDAFMEEGIIPPSDLIAEDIVESWKESLKKGLDPDNIEILYESEEGMKDLFKDNEDLIRCSDYVLEDYALQFSYIPFTVDIYDKKLRLLKRYGKPVIRDGVPSKARPGLLKTMESCGITSVSCAAMRNCATQLIGGEHFATDFWDFACTSVPVYLDGKLEGIISVAELRWDASSKTLGTIIALAKLVENTYEQLKLMREIDREAATNEEMINATSEGIIMMDSDGTIIRANKNACDMLSVEKGKIEKRNVKDVIEDSPFIDTLLERQTNLPDQEIILSVGGVKHRFMGYAKCIRAEGKISGYLLSIRDIRIVKNIMKEVGGWDAKYTFDDIIGSNDQFRFAVENAKKAASISSNTLIEGESGTGKELFAQAIHNASEFSNGPFVSVNCGSIPSTIIESELFGYEKGAFTGARQNGQMGKFELAEGGTIFLDEVNSLPLDMQVKLLSVLQEKSICRVGGTEKKQLHLKIIAASNENLADLVQRGLFRADLYYRLNVITVRIPSLKQRKDDIRDLSDDIVRKHAQGKNVSFSPDVYSVFEEMDWPGNVRELENVIERALVNASFRGDDVIRISDLREVIISEKDLYLNRRDNKAADELRPDDKKERDIIVNVLKTNKGNISKSAKALGISRNTLYQRIYKYGVKINNFG